MLPLNAIPTEVIRKSLVPYQGFVMPFEIDLTEKDRGMLCFTREQISRDRKSTRLNSSHT